MPALRLRTRAELLADNAVHVTGVSAALLAVPTMIFLAVLWHSDASVVVAAAIYGLSMLAMFACSACYHMIPSTEWKDALRRLDHAAIYIKIAGTYTPFAVLLGGETTAAILIGIWTAAVIGLCVKVAAPDRFQWIGLGLYLAMGWAAIVVGGPMIDGASAAGFWLMLTGGVLYTVGVPFHLWDSLPFQNAIWHALVLAASFVFYAAVLVEVWEHTKTL
ncbi:MAG: hemolysin III family protein [Pseudomonadota bacterium]